MGKRLAPAVALLMCALLVTAGCISTESGGGTSGPETSFLNADEAFAAALAWLANHYPGATPKADLTWTSEDVVVLGPGGEPLVGAAERLYSAEGWAGDVTWALVAPDYAVYEITLKGGSLGWFWQGSVRARGGSVMEEVEWQQMTEGLAAELATEFVKGCATYIASGIADSLKLVDSRPQGEAFAWTFGFEFDSRHSGYGYSQGQVVSQVVTPHRAVVTVVAMEVNEAVMDTRWDMVAQRFLPMTEKQAGDIAGLFVRSSPTFVFDGIMGTLELVESTRADMDNGWTTVFRFESAHGGYGDRSGQSVAEVVTVHEARVIVQNGAVVQATMDGTWDMLQQRMM